MLQDAELLKYTKGDLAIIASDITTETKAVFPDHTELYYENPGQVSPSEFVRMSMSIPVFFQPKEVKIPATQCLSSKKNCIALERCGIVAMSVGALIQGF